MTAKPFCDGPFSILKGTNWIVGKDKHGDICHVLDQRGWGYLTGKGHAALGLDNVTASQIQADMQQWVVDALNAAWNRRADLAAVPAQVMVKPWNYCPECGCEEPRYGEGPHKQCARCYQEWFTDIDYSGVVRGNLERLFIAALEPQPDPRDEVFRQLECAVTLYEEYVLVAGGLRAGEWVNSARTALAAAKAVRGRCGPIIFSAPMVRALLDGLDALGGWNRMCDLVTAYREANPLPESDIEIPISGEDGGIAF